MNRKTARMNRKAAITAIGAGLAAIIVIMAGLLVAGETRKRGEGTVKKMVDVIDDGDFQPYELEYSDEEQTVVNSVRALVHSINALAKGEELNALSKDSIDTSPGFSSYRITWAAKVELEERDACGCYGGVCTCNQLGVIGTSRKNSCNSYRDWAFRKEYPVEIGQPTQSYDWVMADYYYGEPGQEDIDDRCWGNDGNWVGPAEDETGWYAGKCGGDDEACYNCFWDETCKGRNHNQDNFATGFDPGNLAAVREATPIYNIKLETLDSSGNVLCTATTQDLYATQDEIDDIKNFLDEDMDALITWGAVAAETDNKGDDHDGDGIKGQYAESEWGKPWQDVLPEGFDASTIDPSKIQRYFPDGVVQSVSDNGEGCLDSPVFLECPGIRIYYCGKSGFESTEQGYYTGSPETSVFSSATGTKYLRVIDTEKFTGYRNGESQTGRTDGTASPGFFSDYENVRDPEWDGMSARLEGHWSEAQREDLDILLGWGAGCVAGGPVGCFAGGGAVLGSKEARDPRVFCDGGKEFGQTTALCDPELAVCGVCDFELPETVADNYDDNLWTIAGYGDPKYLVYYEAFPPGEESAWQMSEYNLGLRSILIWNAAGAVFDAAGIVRDATRVGEAAKHLMGFVQNIPLIGQAFKAVRSGIRAVKFIGSTTADGTRILGDKVMDLARLSTKGASHADIAVETFGNAGRIFKYVDPDDFSHVMQETMGDVARRVARGTDSADELAKITQLFKDPDWWPAGMPNAWDVARQELPAAVLRQGEEYAVAYAVGTVLAQQDSVMEKYYPIGSNAIGVKKPFYESFISGDTAHTDENGIIQVPALDEEAKKYYISLVKDKFKSGVATNMLLDQNNERFYLASPCKANLRIIESLCPCWEIDAGNDEPEAATPVEYSEDNKVYVLDMSVKDTGSFEEKYEYAVKVCRDRSSSFTSVGATFSGDEPVLQTKCLLIDPVLAADTFCYSGSHTLTEISKFGVLAGNMVVSVGNELFWDAVAGGTVWTGVGAPAAIAFKTLLNVGIDLMANFAFNELDKTTKWPNH